LPHVKVCIPRDRALEAAYHILGALGHGKFIIDIEYIGEAGTGLGPTLEFYSVVSTALLNPELRIWRAESCEF
jgi:E3 ubiquitin-protein ligase TRIP12